MYNVFIKNNITDFCKSLRIRHLAMTNDGALLVSTYSDLGQLIIKDDKIIKTYDEGIFLGVGAGDITYQLRF